MNGRPEMRSKKRENKCSWLLGGWKLYVLIYLLLLPEVGSWKRNSCFSCQRSLESSSTHTHIRFLYIMVNFGFSPLLYTFLKIIIKHCTVTHVCVLYCVCVWLPHSMHKSLYIRVYSVYKLVITHRVLHMQSRERYTFTTENANSIVRTVYGFQKFYV